MKIAAFFVFALGFILGVKLYIIILPLSYLIFNLIFTKSMKTMGLNIINTVYQITSFIRFVFIPFLLIFSHDESLSNNYLYLSDDILMKSAFFMCLELFFSLILIQIFLKDKHKNKNKEILNDNYWYVGLISIFIVLIYFVNPQVINSISFILSLKELSNLSEENLGGLSLIFSFILVFLPLFIINFFYSSKFRHRFQLTVLLILPFVLFIKGSSRLSFLIPLLSWYSVFSFIYPKYKKIMSYVLMVSIITLTTLLTLMKSFSNQKEDIDIESITLYFNAYFSGLYNVGYSLVTIDNLDFTHKNLIFNDFIQNIVFLSNFTDRELTTNYLFNRTIYGHSLWADQIVPVVGQSIAYFGVIGAPIISMLLTLCMIYFSNKVNNLNRPSYIYLYSYIGCWFSASFNMLNISSVVSNFTNYFLPLMIVFFICNKFLKVVKL